MSLPRVSIELRRTLYWVPLPASPFAKPNRPRIQSPNIRLINLNILRSQTSVIKKLSPCASVSPHLWSSHQVYKCTSSSNDLHPFVSYASSLQRPKITLERLCKCPRKNRDLPISPIGILQRCSCIVYWPFRLNVTFRGSRHAWGRLCGPLAKLKEGCVGSDEENEIWHFI